MAGTRIHSGLTPDLTVKGAKNAAAFYARAFQAEEIRRVEAEDGERLLHCHLRINGGDLILHDPFPDQGGSGDNPQGVMLHLQVDDADSWWSRARAAGATEIVPLADQFWGDRYGQLQDPFGHCWSIGGPIKAAR